MKIAHIAPINALKEISSKGDIEFCLAPYAMRDDKYKKYFMKAKKKGRYVIMDNGVAEGDLIPTAILVDLAIEMKVDELIIPDVIGNLKETRKLRSEFIKKYWKILKENNIKLMSVIQGNSINEYTDDLHKLLNDYKIDVIGIPFRMHYADFKTFDTREGNHMVNRASFIMMKWSLLKNSKKEIHLLGCNLPSEIYLNHFVSFIRSMDSKLMARYGLNEKIFDLWDKLKPEKKLYITDKMTKKQITYSLKNVIKLKEVINNG